MSLVCSFQVIPKESNTGDSIKIMVETVGKEALSKEEREILEELEWLDRLEEAMKSSRKKKSTCEKRAQIMAGSTVEWGVTQKQHRMAVFRSQIHPGSAFDFRVFRRLADAVVTFRCEADCTIGNVLTRQIYRKKAQEIEIHPRTPTQAHSSALVEIDRLRNSDSMEVRLKYPDIRVARRTYLNHSAKAYPKIEDPKKLPECLKVVGYEVHPDYGNDTSKWQIFCQGDGKPNLLIFSDAVGLCAIWNAKHLVCDGNYKFAPHGFSQIYSIMAVFEDLPERAESFHCAFALMKSVKTEEYVTVFRKLKEAVENRYGPRSATAPPVHFHLDCELAAIHAIQTVHPDSAITLCRFHYGQAILRQVDTKGLKTLRESNPDFQDLLKAVLGAIHLPLALQNAYLDAKLTEANLRITGIEGFCTYIRNTWFPLAELTNQQINAGSSSILQIFCLLIARVPFERQHRRSARRLRHQ
ncbi:hypothetical protein QR680_003749 [Steinernema hermaphroditum]|uniref:MULE transposase domain-containing protein n=1 Tax=Steinernema hermaphroditum TaxID=289476 RepID=A0AA39HLE8_9BILA|nr:hypothetical protein QR680_003749 [Steinernema hermaphroditum]